jgi:acyl carrier protein
MNYETTVLEAAKNLKLVDGEGKLIALDSLNIIDLITEIETATQLAIPNKEIKPGSFRSVEQIAGLLTRLAASK